MNAAVIVDTRNVRGLASSILGLTKSPTITGVERCMARYDLGVARASFSVALPRKSDRRDLRAAQEQNSKYMQFLRRDHRVSILQGELHKHPNGRIEEKLVDVLCAIETVRQAMLISNASTGEAGCVIVISQDMDITPGIELALDFGVPVLTAAPGKVHTRGHPFIVLSERALSELVEADLPHGQPLRTTLGGLALNPDIDSWEYRYTKKGHAFFKHRHGPIGVADAAVADHTEVGELMDLATMGITGGRSNEFPNLELGFSPHLSDDLLTGVVVGRFELLRVTVEIGGGQQVKVYCSDGFLTPGTEVLLQRRPADEGEQYRYICATSDPPPLVGCGGIESPARSVVARITGHRKGHALAIAEAEGIEVFVPRQAANTSPQSRYLVSLVGSGRDARSPFVAYLASSRLP